MARFRILSMARSKSGASKDTWQSVELVGISRVTVVMAKIPVYGTGYYTTRRVLVYYRPNMFFLGILPRANDIVVFCYP